jgi:ketosteroid isomerase-like protein
MALRTTLVERFEAYAADFEQTFADGDWTRLEPHFTEDAAYSTPANGMRVDGRDLVLAVLRTSVTTFDRRCAERTLVTTRGPEEHGDEVRREWAATYTVPGAPRLDIGGTERAVFRDGRIALLEVTMTPDTLARLMSYAATYLLPDA